MNSHPEHLHYTLSMFAEICDWAGREAGGGEPHYRAGGIDWEELEQVNREQLLSELREDLVSNPERLLLNLTLMSVQFLRNYDRLVLSTSNSNDNSPTRSLLVTNTCQLVGLVLLCFNHCCVSG